MKKYSFLAAAALVAMASCSSSDDAIIQTEEPVVTPEVEVGPAIGLNVTSPSMSKTRGTGTVGDVDPLTNKWAGQVVNVFMFDKGTLKLASLTGNEAQAILNNEPMYTPGAMKFDTGTNSWVSLTNVASATAGHASCTNGDVKYYPLQGQYDFWGYRLDDAATGAYDKTTDPQIVQIPFTINGSQDIMTAMSDSAKTELANAGLTEADRFSAKAARHDIQPNLLFKHELTRLVFQIIAGNKFAQKGSGVADYIKKEEVNNYATVVKPEDVITVSGVDYVSKGVYVDSIKVYTAVNGKLTVATINPMKQIGAKFNTSNSDKAWVSLMQRKEGVPASEKLVKLISKVPAGNAKLGDDFEQIGEALLVAPQADCKYQIQVYMHQYKQGKEEWWTLQDPANQQFFEKTDLYYPATFMNAKYIDLTNEGNNTEFATAKDPKGYSFNVKMTVYGLEKIDITTTLDPWKDGGSTDFPME